MIAEFFGIPPASEALREWGYYDRISLKILVLPALDRALLLAFGHAASVTCHAELGRDIVLVYDSLPPSAPATPLATHSAWRFRSGRSHIGRRSARQSETPNRFCNRRAVAPGQVFDAGRFCRGSFSNPIRTSPGHGRDVDSGLRDCQRIFATIPLRRAG